MVLAPADPPVTVAFGASSYMAVEGGAAAAVTVRLSHDPGEAVTVPLTAAGTGGAVAGDFEAPAEVTFESGGALTRTATVTAVDDELAEDGESVVLGFGTLPAGMVADGVTSTTVALLDTAPNSAPTGRPDIGGDALVGNGLLATGDRIRDANGLVDAVFAWQWLQSYGGSDTEIAGATGPIYIPVEGDVGRGLKVRVTYTDDDGYDESVTSEATAAVARPLTAHVADVPESHDGTTAFTFGLRFSESSGVDVTAALLRDSVLQVSRGLVRRVVAGLVQDPDSGRNHWGWRITIKPNSQETIEVVVPAGLDCTLAAAVCTTGGKRLHESVQVRVPGPATVNLEPTGLPVIEGTAEVGETLTASADEIEDGDGLTGASFAWQWLSNDGNADTEIEGATGKTYTLAADDEGKAIKVRVTFTDDGETEETLTSEATAAVLLPLTASFEDVPESHDGSTAFTVELRFSEELNLSYRTLKGTGMEVTGGKVTSASRLERGSNIGWEIVVKPETQETVVVALPADRACGTAGAICTDNTDSGKRLSGRVEFRVPGPATVNSVPTGLPAVEGTARVGETLTASADEIEDADGLTGAEFSWQWLYVEANAGDESSETAIEGATEPSYALTEADAGKAVKVRVTFTDGLGTEESVTSEATESVAAVVPGAPRQLAVASLEDAELLLALLWTAPESDGGSAITGYKVQWKSGSEEYDGTESSTRQAVVTDLEKLTYRIAGVTAGVEYTVRVMAVNDAGDGAAAEDKATARDGVAPVLTAASVNGTALTLTFSEALDVDSKPAEDAFAVTVAGDARTVDAVALSGSAVTLTLASAVVSGETVTVGYTVPTGSDATPLQDAAGNDAASFTGDAVTNETAALPAVSIAAGTSPVTEGADATFTLTRTGPVSAALTVTVEVTESGAVLAEGSPAAVTFEAESATAALELATADDEAAEDASTVTVTVVPGDGWAVDAEAGSAAVAVEDDDAAPEVTTATALSVAENATEVVTLAATDADTDVVSLAWSIPAETGGGADAGAFTLTEAGVLTFQAAKDFEAPDDADGDGTYEVTVRVTDGANPVDAALEVSLTDVDEVAPVLTGAAVNGTALTLTYSEALDGDSSPGAGAFAVTVAEASRTVDAVSVSGSAVTLTLASAVASGETVSVDYTAPTGAEATPLKDGAGNEAASFTAQAVTNDTPAPENTAPTGLPEISGTPQVGVELTASASAIEDGDGLENATFVWQWLSNDGTEGAEDTEIAEATSAGYTAKPGDVGKTLKVRVTFTDDKGTEEVLVSAATETVTATVPDAPGTPAAATAEGREGELTVSWTAPASDGGAAITGYRVQWKSGSEDYDGSETSTRQAEVTGLTYTIAGLTDGTAYTVRIVAVNEAGDGEAVEVSAEPLDRVAPVLSKAVADGATLTLTYSEALDEDSSPAAGAFAVTVAEAARTVDAVDVSGSTAVLTLATAVASGETVTVDYTAPTGAGAKPLQDASDNAAASFTGQAVTNDTPAPENAAPTGLPSISGTPQVGVELTASASAIEDGDGTENATFVWQWLSNDGTDGAQDVEIAEAAAASYTPKPGDVGKVLKVRVTFTDDKGTEEVLVSAATETVAATVPDAPGSPAAATAEGREGELTVSWTAPASDGGAAITGYKVQWKSGSEDYDGSETSTRQAVVTGLTHTIAGLTDGTAYTVRIVAVNEAGDGEAVEVSAEPRDRVVPVLSKAVADGATLTLTYSEALDEDSSPGAGAFAVTVAEAARTVDAVDVSGSAVTLTLATAVASGEMVTVGYTAPTDAGAKPLKDAVGNAAASFTAHAVTNETAASNTAPTGLPAISGTPQVGVELTASASAIEDGDGTENAAFAWQWLLNDGSDGAEDVEIAEATSASYTPKPGDVGKTLKVRATFTDDKGTEEVLVSAATAVVAAAPVEVSIAAASSPVTEGSDAVFTLTRTGDATAALTVGVSVSVSGAFLDGTAPSEVAFAANAGTATLRVATADDGTAEADGRVSASVSSGAGYAVASGAGSAGVDVFDNDKAAPAETVLWSATMTVVDYETGAIGAGSADLLTNIGGSEDLGARSLWYWAPGRKLHLKFSEAIPEGDGLTLHIGSRALALPAGSAGNPGTAWEGIDVDWSDGETIRVRLTKPAAEDTSAAPGLSVADARVREAAGAELAFRVTLDAAQGSAVSVRYATSDGTAVAGSDYVAARGAVRFAPGQTSKTVRVLVLEDAHDDNGETMTLTLSSPFGATLADGQATGTIENTDPLPQAWLARFGRTVAGHVVDAISARFEGSAGGGSHVTLGGQRLSLDGAGEPGPEGAAVETAESEAAAREGLVALAELMGGGTDQGAWTSREERGSVDGRMHEGAGDGAWSMTGRELLLGSSFHLALGGDGDGASAADTRWTAWGRASSSHFDGETDGLSVDGEVTTFTLGGDAAWGRWLGGVAVSLSEGEGGFSDHAEEGDESRGAGALESTLTSVHPYLRYEASERLSVWGILGYGTGELTLEVEDKESWTTDTTMEMAAAGARSVLLSAAESGGVELAVRTDAQLVRMTSDAATGSDGGNLAATEGDTSRLRVMLEGSRAFELEGGGALTPSLELGLRHDGGDAETGTGIEVGGGLSYTDPASGITVDARVRGLAAHEDTDYSEWGASGSVRIEPDVSGRGLSLRIAPSWGVDSGGAEQLWSAGDARGLAPEGTVDPGSRLEAELGYGFTVLDGLGVATPHAGWSRSGESEALRLGQRLNLGASEWRLESEFGEANRAFRLGYGYRLRDFLDLNVEASRYEAANDNPAAHEIGLRARVRW